MTQFLLRLFVKNADQVSDPKVRAAVGTLSGVVGILCIFSFFWGRSSSAPCPALFPSPPTP